jgi:cation transport regulator ChaB
MPVAYTSARTLLAPYVDNGVAATDTARIDQRIDEAQRRLVDHYNFLSRREESARTALTWQSGGTTGNPATGNLIVDNIDATKNMILALWREENNQLDLATSLETKAYSYIERNIINEIERERRTAFDVLAATNQNTFGGLAGRIGLETLIQYRLPESRIKSFINQAYQQAIDHHNFVSRREDKSRVPLAFSALSTNSDALNALLPIEVVRLLALSLIISDNGGDGTGLKQQALELIDRNVTALVEQTRRDTGGEEGRLHNELPEGVKVPTARMTQYLNQAATDASVHWDFLARREDYSSGSKPSPFPFEVRKKLVESYIATANAAVDVATALKGEALSIIERDLMTQVEATRRAVGGEEGKLHNELPEGVRVSTLRMTTYLSQAATEAAVHWDFLARREDYSSGSKPNPFSYEVRKKLVESYIATANAAVEVATALKGEAFSVIERDLMQNVEAARRATGGEEGRLHNELPEGVRIATSRLTQYLSQAATEAGAHWDFLARRENYSSGTKPNPFTYEVRKKFVESYVASGAGQIEAASALKAEGQALIERDLMAQVEAERRAAAGEEGSLHNELPNGVTVPTARLTTYLSQASTEIGAHQAFLQRREDYNGAAPTPTYEQKKMLVESYLATSAGQPDVAAALKQQTLAAVERDVMTAIEAARRSTREALLASANDTFGYHWGRIGLELPEAYKLSDSAVKRMVNAAEEQLMFAGKWVGTVAEYTLSVSATGEFFLPREVETILFMSFDGDPKPVHDRLNEWIRGGTGYRETDDTWREGAVDRGEGIDPADNLLKRKYWITLPTEVPVVRILAKRRFIPHASDSERMYLRNYQAIYEATKGILLGGEQITPHIEKAKEMLAGQIAQQSFQGNRGAAHTRRILQFR